MIEFHKDSAGEWRWTVSNGAAVPEPLAVSSEGYTDVRGAALGLWATFLQVAYDPAPIGVLVDIVGRRVDRERQGAEAGPVGHAVTASALRRAEAQGVDVGTAEARFTL